MPHLGKTEPVFRREGAVDKNRRNSADRRCRRSYIELRRGGQGRIRTAEGVCQWIYSPPHLTTLVPAHGATCRI